MVKKHLSELRKGNSRANDAFSCQVDTEYIPPANDKVFMVTHGTSHAIIYRGLQKVL